MRAVQEAQHVSKHHRGQGHSQDVPGDPTGQED